jgi:hypothetical protein
MDLSYQEKSILGSLLAVGVVFGYYFATVLRDISRSEFDCASLPIGRLVLAVVAIVVIEIVYHILLALESKPEPKDERDTLIASKAYRNAYFLLSAGIFVVMCAVMLAFKPFLIVNLVLFVWVLAELAQFVTQLFYYRRGLR